MPRMRPADASDNPHTAPRRESDDPHSPRWTVARPTRPRHAVDHCCFRRLDGRCITGFGDTRRSGRDDRVDQPVRPQLPAQLPTRRSSDPHDPGEDAGLRRNSPQRGDTGRLNPEPPVRRRRRRHRRHHRPREGLPGLLGHSVGHAKHRRQREPYVLERHGRRLGSTPEHVQGHRYEQRAVVRRDDAVLRRRCGRNADLSGTSGRTSRTRPVARSPVSGTTTPRPSRPRRRPCNWATRRSRRRATSATRRRR